jgi:hypothetical protein
MFIADVGGGDDIGHRHWPRSRPRRPAGRLHHIPARCSVGWVMLPGARDLIEGGSRPWRAPTLEARELRLQDSRRPRGCARRPRAGSFCEAIGRPLSPAIRRGG